MTKDEAEFLGRVAAWLEQAPEPKLSYGGFCVAEVHLVFDGEPIGRWVNDDPDWEYRAVSGDE